MDKRRCLYLSGMFTPSSVFICLFLRLLKVKTSLSCDLFRDEKGDGDSSPVTSFLVLFLDNCHGVLLGSSSIGGFWDGSEFRVVTLL